MNVIELLLRAAIILLLAMLIVLLIFYRQEESVDGNEPDLDYITELIVEAYDGESQYGLHNIIEEGDFDDESIEWHEAWIRSNELGMSEEAKYKGLYLLELLKGLSEKQREEVVVQALNIYWEERDHE